MSPQFDAVTATNGQHGGQTMSDTRLILDVLEPMGSRSAVGPARLAGESGMALAGLGLLAGAWPERAAAQAGGVMRINMATDIQQLDPHLVTAWKTTARGSACTRA